MPRAQQERELLEAARKVFDERGAQDAQIEDIAREAGISKGLVYRHFASKEELYVSAVLVYLDELGDKLEAVAQREDVVDELLDLTAVYLLYGIEHPAFLDCCLSLMRRPAAELIERLSPANAVRLGQAMARSLATFARVLARGREAGQLYVDDPDLWVNYWYTRALGSLHLTRSGVILATEDSPLPTVRVLAAEELLRVAFEDLLADLGVSDPRSRAGKWLALRAGVG
jgi:AcrR family transcriptional regulator